MSGALTERTLVDRRRGLAAWVLGVTAYTGLIVAFYPFVSESDAYADVAAEYPDALKEFFGGAAGFDLTSGPGYLNTQLFSLMLPLLLVIPSIGFGASLAGDEERGRLWLVLAAPVRRRTVIVERALALLLFTGVIALGAGAAVFVLSSLVDLEVSFGQIAAGVVGATLVAALHGCVALLGAALTGRRSLAIGCSAAVFAAGYLVTALAELVDWLELVKQLSPYYHGVGITPVLNEGYAVHFVGLALAAVGLVAVAAGAFERRDLR